MRMVLPEAVAVALPEVTNAETPAPQVPATQGIGRSAERAAVAAASVAATNAATAVRRANEEDMIMNHQLPRTEKCQRASPALVRVPSHIGRAHAREPDRWLSPNTFSPAPQLFS